MKMDILTGGNVEIKVNGTATRAGFYKDGKMIAQYNEATGNLTLYGEYKNR
jgi:hypothetical protein